MVTARIVCVGVLVAFISTPIYKADALAGRRQEQGPPALQDVQSLRGDSPTVSAELEILGSRMILGRVVDRLHLEPWSRRATRRSSAARSHAAAIRAIRPQHLLGLSKYAWGGERIRLESLAVPPSLQVRRLPSRRPMPTAMSCTQAQEELLRGRVGELAPAQKRPEGRSSPN